MVESYDGFSFLGVEPKLQIRSTIAGGRVLVVALHDCDIRVVSPAST